MQLHVLLRLRALLRVVILPHLLFLLLFLLLSLSVLWLGLSGLPAALDEVDDASDACE